MKWSRLKEWFYGWCPKVDLRRAILFQSVRQTPMLNLATNSISVLVFLALSLSVIFQGLFGVHQIDLGGENVSPGFLRLLSILLLCFLGYLFIRWFKLNQISTFDLKTMIPLTFGLYALSRLVLNFNAIWQVSYFAKYPNIFDALYGVFDFGLDLIFGFSLFRLSALVLERGELDARTLRIMIICLASYGILGIFNASRAIYAWYLGEFPIIPRISWWISLFTNVMVYVTIFLLSVDIFLNRSLRKRSIYMTFFSTGVAWLIQTIPYLLRSVGSFYRLFSRHFLALSIDVMSVIARTLSYLLVFVVSFSLIKGRRLERGTFKACLAAIFLYVCGNLLEQSYSIYSSSRHLITNLDKIFESLWAFNIPIKIIVLPYLISLLTIGLLLYSRGELWIKGWGPREPLGLRSIVAVIKRFLIRARSVLVRKKVIGSVSALVLIMLILLNLPSYVGAWTHIAHIEDPVGDHVAPNVDINGEALGGLDYEGADIHSVILYSPLDSDELHITVQLNGMGRGDPTIDENHTRVDFQFSSDKLWGYALLFYDGHGWAGCHSQTQRYDYVETPSERLQWVSDNVVKVTFKGIPRDTSFSEVSVNTERWYKEESDTKYKPLVVQGLDTLEIEDYKMSSGQILTQLDMSKQASPLYNSIMRGMDIRTVDVYKRGNVLNITVTLAEPGTNDNSIPPTFDVKCRASAHKKKGNWLNIANSISHGWKESGNQWYMVLYVPAKKIDTIKITTEVYFDSIMDGEIVDGGSRMRWIFDICCFAFPPEGS